MAGELKRLVEAEYAADLGKTPVIARPRDVRTVLGLLERAYWRFVTLEKMEQETESDRKWLDDYKAAKGE